MTGKRSSGHTCRWTVSSRDARRARIPVMLRAGWLYFFASGSKGTVSTARLSLAGGWNFHWRTASRMA